MSYIFPAPFVAAELRIPIHFTLRLPVTQLRREHAHNSGATCTTHEKIFASEPDQAHSEASVDHCHRL
jgi:hypothetical protein